MAKQPGDKNAAGPRVEGPAGGGTESREDRPDWAELLEAVLQAQSEGVSLVGPDGRIRYANAAMRRILGFEAQGLDTIYGGFERLFPEPEAMARAASQWAVDIQRGEPVERTYEIQRGDGERRWVSFQQARLANVGIVLQATDVTERCRAEAIRAQLEEQLLQAQKMEAVGTLAGGIAHDMNNILGVIMGFASVLQQGEVGGATRAKCVEGILSAARRGRDLTSNLLGFARKGSFRKVRVQPNAIIREVRDLLRRTLPKTIHLRLDLDPELVTVEADAAQISQALMNLCLNAVEAMDGRGELQISTVNQEIRVDGCDSWVHVTPGRYARIAVADDGPGMDRATLARVFEPFFTTKPKGRGTGLGLSMVYGTVMNHSGDVQVVSQPGSGTTVTLLLPEAPPAAEADAPPARPSEPPRTAPARVLLVDDEQLMLQAGKVLLETLGHRVRLAQGGREALHRFRRHQDDLDVVILDLIMPGMDGVDTFRALRQIRPDVRVLLCSGYPRGQRVEELVAEGAAGFLRKPFDLEKLAEELSHALQGARP